MRCSHSHATALLGGCIHLEGFFMRKPSLTSVPMSMISLYVMSLMAMVSLSPDEIAMASTAKVRVRRLTYEKRVHRFTQLRVAPD